MSDTDYYDDSEQAWRAAQDILGEKFPKIAEIIGELMMGADADYDPPAVRLMCPKCDRRIIEVALDADAELRPFLTSTRRSAAAKPSDPRTSVVDVGPDSDAIGLGRVKVRLTCPNRRCGYAGDHRGERLLQMYAVAVTHNMPEIVLPS